MHRSLVVAPALAGTLVLGLPGCAAAAAADRPPALAGAAGNGPTAPAPSAEVTRVVNASLAIPSIGIISLRIVPYKGTTDDWPGTRIQDRGIAASPYGPDGGVGPGQVGNYLVTAHRVSHGGPLYRLPAVKTGDRVSVTAAGTVYVYRITATRTTSFRSAQSLEEQRAAVPGSPGKHPTQAMITLSTCATPEDNAAGNHWRDDRDNPEHRIDKIGVLVETHRAPTAQPTP
jgi:sortase A